MKNYYFQYKAIPANGVGLQIKHGIVSGEDRKVAMMTANKEIIKSNGFAVTAKDLKLLRNDAVILLDDLIDQI